MRLNIYKTIFVFFVFLITAFLVPQQAGAAAPIVQGIVKNIRTGAGIPNVWVKWTDRVYEPGYICRDGDDNVITCPGSAYRYIKTDAEGKFMFPSWQGEGCLKWTTTGDSDGWTYVCLEPVPAANREAEANSKIVDLNYDGVPETMQSSTSQDGHFGCGENPHQLTVIPPPWDTGRYSTESIDINNIDNINYVEIKYNPAPPNCSKITLSPSGPMTLGIGTNRNIVANIEFNGTKVSNVLFRSSNPGVVSVDSPAVDKTDGDLPPQSYSSVIRAGSIPGSAEITSTAYFEPFAETCSATFPVTVSNTAWFQAKGGDIHARRDISSQVPPTADNRYFSANLDKTPGLVSYFGTQAFFGNPDFLSTTRWLINGQFAPARLGYSYFANRLKSEADFFTTSPSASGIYVVSGDMVVDSPWQIAKGEQIIFLVEGDLGVKNKIKVAEGGFLIFIVKDNIYIDSELTNPDLPVLEGIYLADGEFLTGCSGIISGKVDVVCGTVVNTDKQLVAAGVFYAGGGFELSRELDSATTKTTPSELFLFRPDFIANSPASLGFSKIFWQEVLP